MTNRTLPEINEKVRGYFQEFLNKGEEYVLLFPQDPTINILDEAAGLGDSIEQMQRDLAYACYPQDVRDMASSILDTETGKGSKRHI